LQHRPWFEPLVQDLEDRALGFALTLVGDRDSAEEVLQEAFARLWASPTTPADGASFKRFLYRTIVNLARDDARRRKRWSVLRFWVPAPADPLDKVERRADDAALMAALRRLGLREREVVHLRYFEDHSFAEVGELMGVTEQHARVIAHRALAKLRNRLGGDLAVRGVEA
jgi:RNA polymerase sigma factor (sigma-70 family)